ncbi:endonuclease VII domain-containing protein [Actinacidiphila acidipaludis]|nr:endonuclease VII domain-containing protein [Streptomyces acidipaludis]
MPVQGPLTERWTRPGRVPRWYVWWRLLGVQDGHCATCPGPAEVVDHDHVTGSVRGLLCFDCNTTEAAHARALERGKHRGDVCWFASYWAAPPAAPFGWYWPHPDRSTAASFLPTPPAWTPRPTPPLRCSSIRCRMHARGLLLER